MSGRTSNIPRRRLLFSLQTGVNKLVTVKMRD